MAKSRTSAPRKIGCVQHDCAECLARAAQLDGFDFYRGVIAALGALKGMESPDSVHYHEVARTFDLKALVRVARSETGDMEWSGLGEYVKYRKRQDAAEKSREKARRTAQVRVEEPDRD